MTRPQLDETCPHLDTVIDHALELDAVAGLRDHVRQCDECGFMMRILGEVEDVRTTEAPAHLLDRSMDAVEALWTQERGRAKPWEIGATGLLGALTVVTATLVAGTLTDGALLPLAVVTLVAGVAAGWWEWRTEETEEPGAPALIPAGAPS